jgi:hypothetical protein
VQGQLTSSKGPVRMGVRHHEQGIAYPSKIIFLLSKYAPAWDFVYVCRIKKSSLCRLKINHAWRAELCIYFLVYIRYTGPHGSEHLQNNKDTHTQEDCRLTY